MSTSNVYEFTTPVGRLVTGDAFEPQTTDQQGRPLTDKNGNPSRKWFVGVAFEKRNPDFNQFYSGMLAQAMRDWPHLFDQAGNCKLPTFSMKIIDGDGVDQSGRPWAEREGYAGHWVVRFTSGFQPTIYHKDKYDPMLRVTDPNALKRGYYVRIAGTASGNGNNEKPGMYCNLNLIEIYGIGPVIMGGPDASVAFGATTAPTFIPDGLQEPTMIQTMPGAVGGMPAGGVAGMPGAVGGMPGAVGGMPGAVGGMPAGGVVGMPAGGVVGMPAGGVVAGLPGAASVPAVDAGRQTESITNGMAIPGHQAAPGMVTQPGTVPAMDTGFVAGVMGQPDVPATPMLGPNAGNFTYEQWAAQGYSDDQLRAAGVIM